MIGSFSYYYRSLHSLPDSNARVQPLRKITVIPKSRRYDECVKSPELQVSSLR